MLYGKSIQNGIPTPDAPVEIINDFEEEKENEKEIKIAIEHLKARNMSAKHIEMAIEALEEIQQCRAIGTVEQLKTMFDGFWKLKDLCEEYEKYGLPEDYWKLNEMCKEYSAIGTIDDWKRLIEKEATERRKLEEYFMLGSVEEFKALKEKSVAKKPILSKSMMTKREFQICPVCERLVLYDGIKFNYCQYCGQKLDFSIDKESDGE